MTPDGRVQLRIDVVLPDGGTPTEATVRWAADPKTASRSMHHMTWTADRPHIYVQSGDVWIHATGGVAEGLKSEARHLVVSAEDPLHGVKLVLAERAGVHGKVVLPGEFDRPRLEVRLQRYDGEAPPAAVEFQRSDPSVRPRARDEYGFAFHDLEPGGYLLGLSLGGTEFQVVENVWIDRAMVEQDLVVERFDPKQYMEVRVLGPDGQPLRDAQVSITFSKGRRSVAGGNVVLERSDGVFVVDHLPAHTRGEDGTYADGIYVLLVRTQEHGEILRPYDPNDTESMTIRVHEMEGLAIRLQRYEGSPAVGELVAAVRPVGENGVTNPKPVGPDGGVQFGKLHPGSYEVVLLVTKPRLIPVAIHAVEFEPGADEFAIPTPVFHQLVLHVPKNAEDPVFSLRRAFGKETWSYAWAESGEAGELVFEHLTEGTYSLEGHVGEQWVKRVVHIPTDSVIRLD